MKSNFTFRDLIFFKKKGFFFLLSFLFSFSCKELENKNNEVGSKNEAQETRVLSRVKRRGNPAAFFKLLYSLFNRESANLSRSASRSADDMIPLIERGASSVGSTSSRASAASKGASSGAKEVAAASAVEGAAIAAIVSTVLSDDESQAEGAVGGRASDEESEEEYDALDFVGIDQAINALYEALKDLSPEDLQEISKEIEEKGVSQEAITKIKQIIDSKKASDSTNGIEANQGGENLSISIDENGIRVGSFDSISREEFSFISRYLIKNNGRLSAEISADFLGSINSIYTQIYDVLARRAIKEIWFPLGSEVNANLANAYLDKSDDLTKEELLDILNYERQKLTTFEEQIDSIRVIRAAIDGIKIEKTKIDALDAQIKGLISDSEMMIALGEVQEFTSNLEKIEGLISQVGKSLGEVKRLVIVAEGISSNSSILPKIEKEAKEAKKKAEELIEKVETLTKNAEGEKEKLNKKLEGEIPLNIEEGLTLDQIKTIKTIGEEITEVATKRAQLTTLSTRINGVIRDIELSSDETQINEGLLKLDGLVNQINSINIEELITQINNIAQSALFNVFVPLNIKEEKDQLDRSKKEVKNIKEKVRQVKEKLIARIKKLVGGDEVIRAAEASALAKSQEALKFTRKAAEALAESVIQVDQLLVEINTRQGSESFQENIQNAEERLLAVEEIFQKANQAADQARESANQSRRLAQSVIVSQSAETSAQRAQQDANQARILANRVKEQKERIRQEVERIKKERKEAINKVEEEIRKRINTINQLEFGFRIPLQRVLDLVNSGQLREAQNEIDKLINQRRSIENQVANINNQAIIGDPTLMQETEVIEANKRLKKRGDLFFVRIKINEPKAEADLAKAKAEAAQKEISKVKNLLQRDRIKARVEAANALEQISSEISRVASHMENLLLEIQHERIIDPLASQHLQNAQEKLRNVMMLRCSIRGLEREITRGGNLSSQLSSLREKLQSAVSIIQTITNDLSSFLPTSSEQGAVGGSAAF